jgi:putative membrane protein
MRDESAPIPAPGWLPIALGIAFGVLFLALAWRPHDRGDWLLENLISAPLALGLVLARRRLPFSTAAWSLLFAFLALHEIGSHYTYSRVPWMDWSRALLGWAPDWSRNHYDRFLHFAFGVLLTRPFAELLAAPLAASPRLRRVLAICCIVTASSIYELLEWAAAMVVDPELGIAFVGAQGDPWDAQKDMLLALGGSLGATLASGLGRVRRRGGEAGPRSGSGQSGGPGGRRDPHAHGRRGHLVHDRAP